MRALGTGRLILVNAQHPLSGYAWTPELVPVHSPASPVLLEREAAFHLDRLMEELDGWRSITPVSGWRSGEEQRRIYADSLRDNGAAFTRRYVALPGRSEHQTGLAIDLGLTGPDLDFIRPDFPYTGICQEFRRRAADHGFIERYPAGREAVTGIAHEPWHFRYVGAPHARAMADGGLTLEEYLEEGSTCVCGKP